MAGRHQWHCRFGSTMSGSAPVVPCVAWGKHDFLHSAAALCQQATRRPGTARHSREKQATACLVDWLGSFEGLRAVQQDVTVCDPPPVGELRGLLVLRHRQSAFSVPAGHATCKRPAGTCCGSGGGCRGYFVSSLLPRHRFDSRKLAMPKTGISTAIRRVSDRRPIAHDVLKTRRHG